MMWCIHCIAIFLIILTISDGLRCRLHAMTNFRTSVLYSTLPKSGEDMLLITKKWVQAMISDFGVCPYSKSAELAGVPVGNVRYALSNAKTIDEAYEDYWSEVNNMLATSETEISTVLLLYPLLPDFDSFDAFQVFSNTLDKALSDTMMNEDIDNVYFHPEFKFIDKDNQVYFIFDDNGDVIGTSNDIIVPVSYARRSPFPIVNILRAKMVQKAQSNMPEGRVFQKNSDNLERYGSETLQTFLDSRDWSNLKL